jgi:hypothetical protein
VEPLDTYDDLRGQFHIYSTLLAEIFVVNTAMLKSCWSPDEVKSAGDLYLTWLYRIRHRGTFSSIAPDFDRFVNVIAHVNVPGKDELTLRESWLDVSLVYSGHLIG